MAASAGTITMIGASGRTYCVDIFLPDAVATVVTFNPSGKATATSVANIKLPEDVVVTDIATATAPTAVGGTLKINSGVVNGATYRWADRLNTLSNRAKFAIPVIAGDFLSILQH